MFSMMDLRRVLMTVPRWMAPAHKKIAEWRIDAIQICMPQDPSWDLYRSFLAVTAEGSLSGAARALDLTQPTIGRHIEALEDLLGVALFTRSPQGLAPSAPAFDLLPHSQAIASAAQALLPSPPHHTP